MKQLLLALVASAIAFSSIAAERAVEINGAKVNVTPQLPCAVFVYQKPDMKLVQNYKATRAAATRAFETQGESRAVIIACPYVNYD